MTAIDTLSEISVYDLPGDTVNGTSKRRAMVQIRGTSAYVADTLDLATYIPGASDVEGITHYTVANAVSGTAMTWSTTTLTFAGNAGAQEVGVIVNFT